MWSTHWEHSTLLKNAKIEIFCWNKLVKNVKMLQNERGDDRSSGKYAWSFVARAGPESAGCIILLGRYLLRVESRRALPKWMRYSVKTHLMLSNEPYNDSRKKYTVAFGLWSKAPYSSRAAVAKNARNYTKYTIIYLHTRKILGKVARTVHNKMVKWC